MHVLVIGGNRFMGVSLVWRVFLSFEESRRFFKPKKIAMTGNPVRRELAARLLAAGVDLAPGRHRGRADAQAARVGRVAVGRVVRVHPAYIRTQG